MNKKHRNYKSKLARKIVFRSCVSFVILLIVYVCLFFLALSIYRSHSYSGSSPVYQAAQLVKELYPLFLLLALLFGWVLVTFLLLSKPLRYLDEVVLVAERLTVSTNEPVVLPEELKDVQDELNFVREQSNQNARIAKEAEQRKNDLIVYLAHDLKTPLASVIGYLNLLRDEGQISEELREKYLSITLDKAQRLEDLINEFFEIARFNVSNITLQYSRISLTRLMEQLIYEFQPMLKEKGLNCRLSIANDIMLYCDADKIQRVFDNLLRNAVIYSYENSDIDIAADVRKESLSIKFRNEGATIPRENLERLFEQFYRLDSSRGTGSGGAGLGLAIAKEIVELHNGIIQARSADEKIEFEVILPMK